MRTSVGEPPFVEDDQMATFKRIQANDYHISGHVNADTSDLIRKLLVPMPSKRLGMLRGAEQDVLDHRMCCTIDPKKLLAKEVKVPFVPRISDPTDTSNFDSYPAPSSGKKYDRYIDAKYEETWNKEFS